VSVRATESVTARRIPRGLAIPRPRLRTAAAAVAMVSLLSAGAYLGAGVYIYNELASVGAGCHSGTTGTPAAFTIPGIDTRSLLMPRYEDVRFPSRDPRITVAAWYVPGSRGTAGPAVVLVHGLGGCRRRPEVLLPAGMLHRHDVSVLLIDMRDHGDSTYEDGRHAGGTEEYQEVLGGWDWLRGRGFSEARIGLFGESLGAATVMIAAGQEPRVAAVWEDSGYADISEAVAAELDRNGYPTFLAGSAVLAARLVSGDDLATLSPADAARRLGRRPVFITHGTADTRLRVQYAGDLAGDVRQGGGSVEPWIVPGAGHVRAAVLHPAEYERRLVEFFAHALGA
jgi:dipeptidyl aminopeptidase/acylaminoacyl peptidase